MHLLRAKKGGRFKENKGKFCGGVIGVVKATALSTTAIGYKGVREIITAILWALQGDTEGGTCGIQVRTLSAEDPSGIPCIVIKTH